MPGHTSVTPGLCPWQWAGSRGVCGTLWVWLLSELLIITAAVSRADLLAALWRVGAILSTGTLEGKQNDHLLHCTVNLMGDFSLHLELDHVIENMHVLRLRGDGWEKQVCDFLPPWAMMEPCVGGRQKLGQRYSGAATVSAVQGRSPVYSCCYVMVAVVRWEDSPETVSKLWGRDETERGTSAGWPLPQLTCPHIQINDRWRYKHKGWGKEGEL